MIMRDDKGVPEVYDHMADRYAALFSEVKELFEEFVALLPESGRVIDLGCGVGTEAGYLAERGFDVVGLDLSGGMLAQAKRDHPHVDFRKADLRDIPSDLGIFDGVLASYSLIHIPKIDALPALRDIGRVMKYSGVIFVCLQTGESGEKFVDEPLVPGARTFLNIMSREEVERLLSDAGFEVVDSFSRGPISDEELDFEKLHLIARKR
ncbi:MAG: class I SAM-dependent methyltransferase [Candidatus Moranbacteria bacterium]|nr:class I SAM-dependent methyltransferase [Candidatus Moranbacteria bacterium]